MVWELVSDSCQGTSRGERTRLELLLAQSGVKAGALWVSCISTAFWYELDLKVASVGFA